MINVFAAAQAAVLAAGGEGGEEMPSVLAVPVDELIIGIIFGQGVQAIARQPEAYGVIRQNMILGFALAEAQALIGFVAPFVFGP